MIIRSQERHGFVNFENIDTLCISTEWEIVTFNGNVKSYLGQYSTEEKAIKVLDMIQNVYTNSCKVAISSDGQMQHMVIPVVFQMPQDSEV